VLPLLALAAVLWFLMPHGDQTREPVQTSKATPEAKQIPTGTIVYLQSAPETWVSVGNAPNNYVNQDVYNRNGEKLGTIKDLLMGPDGRMAAIVVNVGRDLGIGDKDIGVPYSALETEQRDGGQRIFIRATKEALQAAPVFQGQRRQ
jgi:hypothetical protein